MNRAFFAKSALACALLGSSFFASQVAFAASTQPSTQKKTAPMFKNDEDKVSYIIGHQIASSLQNDGLKVNTTILVKAIESGLSGKPSELSPQESQAFMQKYISNKEKVRGEENLKEGQDYLAKNKSVNGVVTLASGLQYKVITQGTGAKPTANDTVTVNYEGTLINGKIFDSSYQRGQPVSFPVNGVIKGWTEALQLMPEGSTWMLYIPANLAYGPQAPSPVIGANSTLIFKVNLISIAKKPAAAPAK
jgi:FKBP-type peptidyl-prolyl cis-trans isomerase FklB